MNFFKPIKTTPTLLATCGATLLLSAAASVPAQAAGYTKVNSGIWGGRTYEVWKQDTGTLTWSQAKTVASSMLGGPLVSINTAAENTFVSGLIQNAALYSDLSGTNNFVGPYIGLRRTGPTDATWQWEDGTPITYNGWFDYGQPGGQPDGLTNGMGDNVGLFYNGSNGTLAPTPSSPVGFPTTWGDVYDGTTFSGGGTNFYLANSFVIEKVPGPLPVMGALVGFRLSRRLRRRTSEAARNL